MGIILLVTFWSSAKSFLDSWTSFPVLNAWLLFADHQSQATTEQVASWSGLTVDKPWPVQNITLIVWLLLPFYALPLASLLLRAAC